MAAAHSQPAAHRADPSLGSAAACIFTGAVAASAVLRWSEPGVYAFLFGELDPLLVTAVAALVGAAALRHLASLGFFSTHGARPRTVWLAAALGAGLTAPVVIVDLAGGFPAEMNVPFPQSLLFYPSIAVVAEAAFHLVPLALLATLWRCTTIPLSRARLAVIAPVALIEPALQIAWGSGLSPLWANTVVGVSVLVFNLVGLEIFRRSGFVALCTFRIGYYLVWHIIWGHLRLSLLFSTGA